MKKLAVVLCWAVLATITSAQTFTTLFYFNGNNGGNPSSNLAQGPDGSFYGTTPGGGTYGHGTVFRIASNGKLQTLYQFCSQPNCTDGSSPEAGLVLGNDGQFYGTTLSGGVNTDFICPLGCGTIFKINTSGKLETIYSFCSSVTCPDGAAPYSALTQGSDGNFYGTASAGGDSTDVCDGDYSCGTVYEFSPSGTLTVLHNMNSADGYKPFAGLVQASDGNFYGVAVVGGDLTCEDPVGCGTIFRVTESGVFTKLHDFEFTDGLSPMGTLIEGSSGELYGTTFQGGNQKACPILGCGTIFKISLTGAFNTIFAFDMTDGDIAQAGLFRASDENFYGTTFYGGNGKGIAYEITPSGAYTVLYQFGGASGAVPAGGISQGTNGILYGTTADGGNTKSICGQNGCGTIYSISSGLAPFVGLLRTTGRTGTGVGILGQGFSGATSVTFNGTSATFRIVSDTFIETFVPARATTGYVAVTSTSGVLTSNVPFHVLP